MGIPGKVFKDKWKKFRDRHTYEAPTGPHTDVRKRKLKPSLKKKITRPSFAKPDIRKKLTDALAGGVKGKPHSSPSGQAASVGRKIKRISQAQQKRYKAKDFYAKGGRAGYQGGGRTNLLEELGRVEAEPSNRNRRAEISRVHGELNRGYKGGGRTKKFAGGPIIKKIINKLKPKGVFKPKPGAVKDVNVDKVLKNLGDEIKAAPLPPQLKKSLDKLKKAYPHKKAKGGRIGLKHGSAQSHYLQHGYGPTKTRLRTGKPKIAIKGWS